MYSQTSGGRNSSGNPPGCSRGCLTGCAVSVVGFAIIIAVLMMIGSLGALSLDPITVSTTNRSPLRAGICVESPEWYEDNVQWLTKPSSVIAGLKNFYKKTGVQPYVIISDQIGGKGESLTDEEAQAYLEERYDTLFHDEGHLIYLFLEYESGVYKQYLYLGNQAASVIDREAQEIIYDYADYFYTSDLDDNTFFFSIFNESADRIMRKTTTSQDIIQHTVLVIGVIAVISVLGFIMLRKKKYDLKQTEEKRKILETPIDNLDDENLKNKYKD